MFPCSFNLDKMSGDGELREDRIELRLNRAIEMQFESKTLDEYWCSAMVMFPRLRESALVVLIPFATTYLCEHSFIDLRRNQEIAFMHRQTCVLLSAT